MSEQQKLSICVTGVSEEIRHFYRGKMYLKKQWLKLITWENQLLSFSNTFRIPPDL
jgi:hypothetical protein